MRTALATLIAASLLALVAPAARAGGPVVDDDGRDCPNANYRTITAAVAAAHDGDVITICAGTYAEQLLLTKSLRLVGNGHPVLRPGTLTASLPSAMGGKPVSAAILVDDARVILSGIVVDLSGNGILDCLTVLAGVYLHNASATLNDVDIGNVRVSGAPGCDSGVGLFAESGVIGESQGQTLRGKSKVKVRDSHVHGCQKGGIVMNGAGTRLKLGGGEIVGDGLTNTVVQNGIQVALGANAKIGATTIRGFSSGMAGKAAAGILAYDAGHASVRGTTVMDSQEGVLVVGRAIVQGAELKNLGADGIAFIGNANMAFRNAVEGAGVSGIFVHGNDNTVRFGYIADSPIGVWNNEGSDNNYTGIRYGGSVPLTRQTVAGGVRDFDRTTAAPLLSLCQADSDCDDGSSCTVDACDLGTHLCTHLFGCSDGNSCTTDSCGPAGCLYTPNSDPCNDNNACTANDHCVGGACAPGTPVDCSDGSACTLDACGITLGCVHLSACDDHNPCTVDQCSATTGCSNTRAPNGTPCPDSNLCNGSEQCQNGVCMPGVPGSCDDGNPCTIDSCNPTTGCVHTPVTNNTPCPDASLCNGLETCQAGVCRPGKALDCSDGNPCTTDSCNATTGCYHTPLVNGTSCSDNNVCNGAEVCQAGACIAGTPLNCDDGNACTTDSCDPVIGCKHVAATNGTSCSDGNVCNGAEVCQAGVCTTGTALNCDDKNACTIEACDPVTGCSHTAIAGCKPCTITSDCNDSNPCTNDVCNAGVCQNTTVPNGTSCADGTVCNGAETCQGGVCTPGTALVCDDQNPCTTDTCDPVAGCQHVNVANGLPCPDATVCNGAETCQNGVCTAGAALNCVDANPCTADSCDPVLGCQHTPVVNGTSCADITVCNGTETCQNGVCSPGTQLNGADGNACTTDTCNAQTGCQHTPAFNGTSCADTNVCNGAETCLGGVCVPGTALNCDDGNPCTADTCNSVTGCAHTPVPNGTPCLDGNVCNGSET